MHKLSKMVIKKANKSKAQRASCYCVSCTSKCGTNSSINHAQFYTYRYEVNTDYNANQDG